MLFRPIIYSLSIIVSLIGLIEALPLYGSSSKRGLPFLLYQNAALLANQNGTTGGLSLLLNNTEVEKMQIGISSQQGTNGFGLGYIFSDSTKHCISTGFGKQLVAFFYGGALSVIIDKSNIGSSIDAYGTAIIGEKNYLAGSLKNILPFDTSITKHPSEIGISSFGIIGEILDLGYLFTIRGIAYDFPTKQFGFGISAEMDREFLKNPTIAINIGGELEYTAKKEMDVTLFGGILLSVSAGSTRSSLAAGTVYDPVVMKQKTFGGISFSPNSITKESLPKLEIKISKKIFSPNGDGTDDNIGINILINKIDRKQELSSWTILISSDPDDPQKVIKIFSGGSLPPATIWWDGRNSKNLLQNPGQYFIRLVCLDKKGDSCMTPWEQVIMTGNQ